MITFTFEKIGYNKLAVTKNSPTMEKLIKLQCQ